MPGQVRQIQTDVLRASGALLLLVSVVMLIAGGGGGLLLSLWIGGLLAAAYFLLLARSLQRLMRLPNPRSAAVFGAALSAGRLLLLATVLFVLVLNFDLPLWPLAVGLLSLKVGLFVAGMRYGLSTSRRHRGKPGPREPETEESCLAHMNSTNPVSMEGQNGKMA